MLPDAARRRRIGFTHQHMPHILIGSLEAAEADAGAQQTLATPHVAGRHLKLPHTLGFWAVHFEFDRFLHVGLQEVFQQVAFFILGKQRNVSQFRHDGAKAVLVKKQNGISAADCRATFPTVICNILIWKKTNS